MSNNVKFEVAIYNQLVAEAVARGESHKKLPDDWADVHYVEIGADDLAGARRRAASRYPAEDGFVIKSIEPIEQD